MDYLIDTDIAIHWSEGNPVVRWRFLAFDRIPFISAITRIELENGVYRDPKHAPERRNLLDAMLRRLEVINVTDALAIEYGALVSVTGYSRRKVNDRIIAATALAHDMTLVTMNIADFRDVPGLCVEDWGTGKVA